MMISATTKAVCTATVPRIAATQLVRPAACVLLKRAPAMISAARNARNARRPFTSTATRPFTNTTLVSAPKQKELKLKLASEFTESEPAWPHPVYTPEQMETIKIEHRQCNNWSDWIALSAVRTLRWSFDLVTGYKHDAAVALSKKDPSKALAKYSMSEKKWLTRMIFLESIAGVPGMVGGMIRHLHSLRLLRRDHGWIQTLLEESQNERMHLLTFLKFRNPGLFMRTMLLGAQGVFFNLFFLCYLVSPKTCHRFVGYLEEEAVITYTRTINDLDAGLLPEWENMRAPQIAREYFKLEPGHDNVRDLLVVIRADEAKHREVNHTLANLEQTLDSNPYAAEWPQGVPQPTKGLAWVKGTGWERSEIERIANETGTAKTA